MQWGAGSQPNAATAVLAGVWPAAGDFVPHGPAADGEGGEGGEAGDGEQQPEAGEEFDRFHRRQ